MVLFFTQASHRGSGFVFLLGRNVHPRLAHGLKTFHDARLLGQQGHLFVLLAGAQQDLHVRSIELVPGALCLVDNNLDARKSLANAVQQIQVALFGLVILGDRISWLTASAGVLATIGVILMSLPANARSPRMFLVGWATPAALSGLASGAAFALSAVGYRGAALELAALGPIASAALSLFWAQLIQTLLLGGWLLLRSPAVVVAVLRAWRLSLAAGFLGALASALWFTAFALEPVAHVRTLGMIELIFSILISARLFRERFSAVEWVGLVLLSIGLLTAVIPH